MSLPVVRQGVRAQVTPAPVQAGVKAGTVAGSDAKEAEVNKAQHDLLTVLYWWHTHPRGKEPKWVREHPLWPANNESFHKGTVRTAAPGYERLWDAVAAEFKIQT